MWWNSRPLHGESIYLQVSPECMNVILQFSSPPRGIYISTGLEVDATILWQQTILVPSTGNLYIYMLKIAINVFCIYSRPLHGESIYLRWYMSMKGYYTNYSRPLHGESIYLRFKNNLLKDFDFILVPSTGNLYIYMKKQEWKSLLMVTFSSPPRGIYISTLSLLSRKDTGLIIQFAAQTRKPDNFH